MNQPSRFVSAVPLCAALVVGLAAGWAGCSSSQTTTTEPTAEASSEPTSAPIATAEASAAPVATTEPTATMTAEPASTLPPPSGRPPLTFEKTDKASETIGATPATTLILKNDGATLKVPEYALNDGVLVTFMIDKKATKKAKGGAGAVYRLQGQRPPAEEYSTVVSRGPKFTVKLPTAKVGSPNLAIGVMKKDEKGKDVLSWKVIAPTKKDDAFATFELDEFTDAMLQVTSEAP